MAEANDLKGPEPMRDRTQYEIRQDIASRRESITETVDRLGERMHENLDWRAQVARHPYVALSVAASLGFIVSGWFKPRPRPWDRISDAVAETVEGLTDDLRHSAQRVVVKAAGPSILKGVVAAAVAKAASEFLRKKTAESVWESPTPQSETRSGS